MYECKKCKFIFEIPYESIKEEQNIHCPKCGLWDFVSEYNTSTVVLGSVLFNKLESVSISIEDAKEAGLYYNLYFHNKLLLKINLQDLIEFLK
jgi:DNA-directed RNA polymerase subunit RPC12/RpoP